MNFKTEEGAAIFVKGPIYLNKEKMKTKLKRPVLLNIKRNYNNRWKRRKSKKRN